MSNATEAGRKTISVADAAKELGVSSDSIMRWIEAGHIPVFVPPGHDFSDERPGPKGYKIWLGDWDDFKRRQTFVGGLPALPVKPSSAARGDRPAEYGKRPKRQR